MRRALAVLILLACLCLAAPAAMAKPLKRGSTGVRVERVQRELGLTPDGVFGSATVRAVKRFQRRRHIEDDGIVGTTTWRLLTHSTGRAARHARTGAGSAGRPRVQTRGSAVALLQQRLGIAADGVFGPGTARAVRTFQRSHGLTADGIVGAATWVALGVRDSRPVLKRATLRRGRAASSVGASVLARAIAAGNRIARLPYRWGGGHGSFSDTAYDCSGSVSYVLHALGRLSAPLDSGQLMSYGSPGPGRLITIYANAGHAFMVIGGRRFDTTGRWDSGSRWQPSMRSTAGYSVRHPSGL